MQESLGLARDLRAESVLAAPAIPVGLTARASRVVSLDITRGLLVLLMTSSHALTLAEVPLDSFWTSSYWLPRGWATFSFTILSGFTMARVLPWARDQARAQAIVRRRALQLLTIFFVSNAAFELARIARGPDWTEAASADWWIGLLTFRTAYGLSGVLLPITIVLAIAPALYKCRTKWGWAGLTAGVTAATLVAWWVGADVPRGSLPPLRLFDMLFYDGLSGFVVAPLVGCGSLGFCLGLKSSIGPPERLGIQLLGFIVAGLLLRTLIRADVPPSFVWAFTVTMVHFVVLLYLGALLAEHVPGLAVSTLGLIGQYALFSFLAHRVILQTAAIVLDAQHAGGTALYFLYFLGTIALLWLLCRLRSLMPGVDRPLKAVGL